VAPTEKVALPPEHIVTLDGCAVITVEGFTVTVNAVGVPTQPFAVGVTVTVAVTGDVPALFGV
jgi:hypothetical protein